MMVIRWEMFLVLIVLYRNRRSQIEFFHPLKGTLGPSLLLQRCRQYTTANSIPRAPISILNHKGLPTSSQPPPGIPKSKTQPHQNHHILIQTNSPPQSPQPQSPPPSTPTPETSSATHSYQKAPPLEALYSPADDRYAPQ